MSKFHSTVSRRDFMKGLGFGAAGLGAAGAAVPVIHDLDELISAPQSLRKRAWWIKEVDEPTVEIDWNLMARHHGFHSAQSGAILSRYVQDGPAGYSAIGAAGNAAITTGVQANKPGLTLRDLALANASPGLAFKSARTDKFEDSRVGIFGLRTPADYGVPKWSGSPEENTRMMKAAMAFFGASDIGASEMDEHHKKLVGTHGDNIPQSYWPFGSSPKWPPPDSVTQPINFGSNWDYDNATGTTTIPDHGVYSISYIIPQSNEMFRTTPQSALFRASNISRYRLRENVRWSTQTFLRGLGYTCMYDEPYRGIPSAAGACLTGLTENSRQTNMALSPEHGSTVGLYEVLTDLPMEPTKPIDAGMWKFCQTCGVCAAHCPSDAIEKKGEREPSFEPYPPKLTAYWPELPGLGFDSPSPGEVEYNKVGRKTYWTDGVACRLFFDSIPCGCAICFGTCTFNSQYTAMIHDVVRATAATTSLFNGFFAQMSETFRMGLKEGEAKEEWWGMSLPSYSYDTSVGAKHGGYR